MSDFQAFAKSVSKQLSKMTGPFFRSGAEDLYDLYLQSFPSGTNPQFRERTEHDCNTCKQFIKGLGLLLTIKGNKLVSVWDCQDLSSPYKEVAEALSTKVKSAGIKTIFRTSESSYGTESNIDNYDPAIRWFHLNGKVPSSCITSTPDAEVGRANSSYQVLERGLKEIRIEDIDLVLDLITQNSIYRGQEFKPLIKQFKRLKAGYDGTDIYVWKNYDDPAAHFRNTAIGTLFTDLASGDDVETAVRKFGVKLDPLNYKHPKSLITPKMIEKAIQTLGELGLDSAVERRFAKITDVSINDVLFVDNSVAGQMKNSLTSVLLNSGAVIKPKISTSTSMPIQQFMESGFKKIELVLGKEHMSNFVSLTAPKYPDSGRLFKWENGFAWSYDGEVTDSIKSLVQKRGGNVTSAVMRCSLAWFNTDDLDIHCFEPDGNHISFANKQGVLDVDANWRGPLITDPVENLSWCKKPKDGDYLIVVDNFQPRSTSNPGFKLQIECGEKSWEFDYVKRVGKNYQALTITVKGGVVVGVKADKDLSNSSPLIKWGVQTETPTKVQTILLSPNHWEGAGGVGNRHWFFILENCVNPDPVRGIYNEFLRSDLDPHRKVFEVLGSKTKCQPTSEQLSGVGFSSTRSDKVRAIADGRPVEIVF